MAIFRLPSLKTALLGLVLLFGVMATGAVTLLVILPHHKEIRQVRFEDIKLGLNHLQAAISILMRHDNLPAVRGLLSSLGSDREHNISLLVDAERIIIAATDFSLVGKSWNSLGIALPHEDWARLSRAEHVLPLRHAPGEKVRGFASVCWSLSGGLQPRDCGFLYQEFDFSPRANAGRRQIFVTLAALSAGIAAACLGILLMLRAIVTDRTDQLLSTVEDFSAGRQDARAKIAGRDELARLGARIDALLDNIARTQKALQTSERKFRDLAENLVDWVWEVDERGAYRYSNPQSERILGYPPSEVLGRTPFDFMPPEEAARVSAVFLDHVKIRAPMVGIENVNLTKDGRAVVLETSGVPVYDEDGTYRGYRGVDRDITERRRIETEKTALERELLHAQKMQALGRLTGGVAHEFNNLLTSIRGFTKLALEEAEDPEIVRSSLATVIEATDQAAALTGQMLGFARKRPLESKLVPVGEVLEGVARLVKPLLGKEIAFTLMIADPDAPIEIDPNQLFHALLNLAINARDAMPQGGGLDIQCRTLGPSEVPPIHRSLLKGKRGVEIIVRDTGHGMDALTLSRVFEPFFTTKEVGKGTGLGLAMVYGFIEQSGGAIDVSSEPGRGTIFSILLPLAEKA